MTRVYHGKAVEKKEDLHARAVEVKAPDGVKVAESPSSSRGRITHRQQQPKTACIGAVSLRSTLNCLHAGWVIPLVGSLKAREGSGANFARAQPIRRSWRRKHTPSASKWL